MDKFIEYAPAIIVIMGFFIAYKIFVTLAISELKEDIAEIKDKIDKIYDKIMGV